jgi:CheY-like chemotaxis protein
MVLCVDDLATNLEVRTIMLRTFGCDTLKAEDHHSAMQLLSESSVDVMVIDYHLADGQTGDQLARDVRAMRPEIALIMLTGDSKLPDSASESVDAVLIKGTSSPSALIDLIEDLVPGAQLRPRPPMPG